MRKTGTGFAIATIPMSLTTLFESILVARTWKRLAAGWRSIPGSRKDWLCMLGFAAAARLKSSHAKGVIA